MLNCTECFRILVLQEAQELVLLFLLLPLRLHFGILAVFNNQAIRRDSHAFLSRPPDVGVLLSICFLEHTPSRVASFVNNVHLTLVSEFNFLSAGLSVRIDLMGGRIDLIR